MCWFHIRKAVNDKLSILNDSDLATEIMQDIDALQIFPTVELFDIASKLFLAKWRGHRNPHMPAALCYFEKEWLIDDGL